MSFSEIFHPLSLLEGETLPAQMNDPFDYEPHPLCCRAAAEVCAHLGEREKWHREVAEGKMFGVLVVRKASGEVGYLAAFSGNLCGSNFHPGFVPPVYDMLQPGEHFRRGEAYISDINRRIQSAEQSADFLEAKSRLDECEERCRVELERAKQQLEVAKAERDAEREHCSDAERLAELIRESQHQKAEFARLKKRCREQVESAHREFDAVKCEIDALRAERKRLSEELQMWIFEQFRSVDSE